MHQIDRTRPMAQSLLAVASMALLAGVIPAQQAGLLAPYAIAIVLGAAALLWVYRSKSRVQRFNAKAQSGLGLATCVAALAVGLLLVGSTVATIL